MEWNVMIVNMGILKKTLSRQLRYFPLGTNLDAQSFHLQQTHTYYVYVRLFETVIILMRWMQTELQLQEEM